MLPPRASAEEYQDPEAGPRASLTGARPTTPEAHSDREGRGEATPKPQAPGPHETGLQGAVEPGPSLPLPEDVDPADPGMDSLPIVFFDSCPAECHPVLLALHHCSALSPQAGVCLTCCRRFESTSESI